MVTLTQGEPQSATDYAPRTVEAVNTVLVEIGQALASFKGKLVVIGGAVPWLLIDNEERRHIGTQDIDLCLDAEALAKGEEYVDLVKALLSIGYLQEGERKFQLVREVKVDDGPAVRVMIDFLMPEGATIEKNRPPRLSDFAVQRASGGELALKYQETVVIEGRMPIGGRNRVEVAVASIPAFLAMKGFAIGGRQKSKDAYDTYYCIRYFPGGYEALAEACRPLLEHDQACHGYALIAEKFEAFDTLGPTLMRVFVEGAEQFADRTPDEWQQEAFGQVQAWLKALGVIG